MSHPRLLPLSLAAPSPTGGARAAGYIQSNTRLGQRRTAERGRPLWLRPLSAVGSSLSSLSGLSKKKHIRRVSALLIIVLITSLMGCPSSGGDDDNSTSNDDDSTLSDDDDSAGDDDDSGVGDDDDTADPCLVDVDADGVTVCGPDGLPGTADDDCDDVNAAIFPGAPELCDGIDNDCDTLVPADETDDDGDMFNECADDDCNDSDVNTFSGAAELCDGADNDCDTLIPTSETTDADGDGLIECEDCDDTLEGAPCETAVCCYTLQMWDAWGQGFGSSGWGTASLSVDASDPVWNSGPHRVTPSSPGPGWWDVQTFCVGQGLSFDLVYASGGSEVDPHNGFQLFETTGTTAVELLSLNSKAGGLDGPAWIGNPYGSGASVPNAGVVGSYMTSCTAPDVDPTGGWDTDGDGFGPSEGDCDDNDPHVFPGQTMWFSSDIGPAVGGGWDYDCDGTDTKSITATASCNPCVSGWLEGVAACGSSWQGYSTFCQVFSPTSCVNDLTHFPYQGCR